MLASAAISPTSSVLISSVVFVGLVGWFGIVRLQLVRWLTLFFGGVSLGVGKQGKGRMHCSKEEKKAALKVSLTTRMETTDQGREQRVRKWSTGEK
ncbi:hypothetical protein B0T20DRAFT_212795 [Sordaria brevicollis]|uniref:Transmembrane protein n=1 Tax=Sordaria brevicollis TaxID=83679 RepID=A0AAE0PFJ2_SORBR|nr:hypothetical protein B0T20DRAFT_212795 [Sordaria brevicollis]